MKKNVTAAPVRAPRAPSDKVLARYAADSARAVKATDGDPKNLTPAVLKTLKMSAGKARRMIAFATVTADKDRYYLRPASLGAAIVKAHDAGMKFPALWARTLRPEATLRALYVAAGGTAWKPVKAATPVTAVKAA